MNGHDVRMGESKALLSALLIENHLEFLATHRSRVSAHGDSFTCESEKPAFAMTFALSVFDALAAAAQSRTLYVPSWVNDSLEDVLTSTHRETHSLAYMVRRVDARTCSETHASSAMRVHRASAPPGIDDFAAVQAAGFCETPDSRATYEDWMRAANHRNASAPCQHFYVGYLDGVPVSCALVVDSASLAGVFAVATLPAFRGRGLSRTVMMTALAEARLRGFGLSGLAVVRGSPAERFYLGLGYLPVFRMHVLTSVSSNA